MEQEEEKKQRLEEQIRNLPVSDHLLLMMHSLSDLALLRLGLIAETKGQVDLKQAQLAIDAYKSLLEIVEKACPREQTVPRRHVLAQLQLAYAASVEEQAKVGSSTEASASQAQAQTEEKNTGEQVNSNMRENDGDVSGLTATDQA